MFSCERSQWTLICEPRASVTECFGSVQSSIHLILIIVCIHWQYFLSGVSERKFLREEQCGRCILALEGKLHCNSLCSNFH